MKNKTFPQEIQIKNIEAAVGKLVASTHVFKLTLSRLNRFVIALESRFSFASGFKMCSRHESNRRAVCDGKIWLLVVL